MLLYFGDAEFVTLKTGRIQCHALSRTFLYAARGKQEPLNDVTPVHGLARSLECVCSWPSNAGWGVEKKEKNAGAVKVDWTLKVHHPCGICMTSPAR